MADGNVALTVAHNDGTGLRIHNHIFGKQVALCPTPVSVTLQIANGRAFELAGIRTRPALAGRDDGIVAGDGSRCLPNLKLHGARIRAGKKVTLDEHWATAYPIAE